MHQCNFCNKNFEGRKKKFCSFDCRDLAYGKGLISPIPRPCHVCGESFKSKSARNWDAKSCSEKCRKKANNGGHKAHTGLCDVCDQSFVYYQSKAIRTCSAKCRQDAAIQKRKSAVVTVIRYRRICAGCGCAKWPAITSKGIYICRDCREAGMHARVHHKLEPASHERRCIWCDALFCRLYGNKSKCCSDACRAAVKRAQIAKDKREQGTSHRRRAKYFGVDYESVNIRKVFERDGWRCQICGCKTPERLRGKHKHNSPELDHRIALSNGGSHTYDNVQCACRRCNGEKHDGPALGQMPLFSIG